MRVFVVGTGRCGSVTLSKACKNIKNYSSSHESKTSPNNQGVFGDLEYPENHIEIDPRMSYHIFSLREKYKDGIFFHLLREESGCVRSLSKRKSLRNYSTFHYGWFDNDYDAAAKMYYENTTKMLKSVIPESHTIVLENIEHDWVKFCKIIKAECDQEKALIQLKQKYNRS